LLPSFEAAVCAVVHPSTGNIQDNLMTDAHQKNPTMATQHDPSHYENQRDKQKARRSQNRVQKGKDNVAGEPNDISVSSIRPT
jgi:hypothetical protein